MELYSVLVTGANRGLGLEFVRQLVGLPKPPRYVFATYRSKETLGALAEIRKSAENSQVVLIQMDVNKLEDIVAARKTVGEAVGEYGLTLLINNAGVALRGPFPNITEECLLTCFTNNTIAPIRVFQEMLPLLQKSARRNSSPTGMRASRAAVLNMTSMVGSLANTGVTFTRDLAAPSYKVSKAALNMAMRVIAANVKEHGILVINMCPGWVKTDMGSELAEITPEESISAVLTTLAKLDETHHGTYMDRCGKPYPF